MKVAVVVQRYGAEINGGAELHARYIAEHLARHVEIEVLTTCARSYISWADEYPAGVSRVGGVPVHRFPVARTRSPQEFGRWSTRVFETAHSLNDELAWLDAEGPTSPALVRHLSEHGDRYDFVLLFSMRYYHAWHGARAVPDRAILVPTAERDEVLGLEIFRPILRGVRACMYNSPEERAVLQAMAGRDDVPGVVVGVGSELPESPSADRFRDRTGIHGRIALYVGRIDENKGCAELFTFWQRYSEVSPGGLTLVLIGTPVLPVPDHPRIRHLGFVDDEAKYDALQAAEFLIMPSYFESLSMVALEAWGVGKPVLVNGRCDVLRGQAMRSNAGLYYENYAEFVEAVRVLESAPGVAAALGRNGRRFFQAHYTWPIVEQKYLDMFDRLAREPAAARSGRVMEPLPGWWRRRQRSLRAAREVLAELPAGPVVPAAGAERTPPARRETPRPATAAAVSAGPATPPAPRERPERPGRQDARGQSERSPRTDRVERDPRSRPQGRDRHERGDRRRRAPAAASGNPAPAADNGPAAAPGPRPRGRGRPRRGRGQRRPAGKQDD
ncbi:MAG: glycosyltransferase [Vicinamibacterales bacterium]